MDCPDIGEYCLVDYDGGFNRGKVVGVEYPAIMLTVFCVDIGITVRTAVENVYDLPKDLLEMCPFQV